jgi:ribosomal protein L32
MKNIVESQFGTFHTSETTTCPKCGKLVRWATSRLYDSDDDKFSNVVDKLMCGTMKMINHVLENKN